MRDARPPLWLGGISSALASCVTHPLDLVKVRMQTSNGRPTVSIARVFLDIVKHESILGLFNGLSAALLRQLTYSTVRFGAYDIIKERWAHQHSNNNKALSLHQTVVAGCVSGALAGAVGTPADIVNVRMQNDAKLPPDLQRRYTHAFNGILRISKEEGLRALFRGGLANIQRAMLMTSSQLGTYDLSKQALLKIKMGDNIVTHFLASLCAGLVATTVSSPVDVVKTRWMADASSSVNASSTLKSSSTSSSALSTLSSTTSTTGTLPSQSPQSRSIVRALGTIVKEEGAVALFKGWVPAFTRLGPQTILTFVILEQLKKVRMK